MSIIRESISFTRGEDPKKTLGVGIHSRIDLLEEIVREGLKKLAPGRTFEEFGFSLESGSDSKYYSFFAMYINSSKNISCYIGYDMSQRIWVIRRVFPLEYSGIPEEFKTKSLKEIFDYILKYFKEERKDLIKIVKIEQKKLDKLNSVIDSFKKDPISI